MKKNLLMGIIFPFSFSWLFAIEVTLKDIIKIGDQKKNYFTGYGLVVGLRGTGDRRALYTGENLKNVLQNYGINTSKNFNSRNVASVIISAETTGYLNKGDIIDITVASIGDARSIANGFLIPSPLKSGDGTTYIVGSGIVNAGDNHPTRGFIASGGIIERDFSSITFNDFTFPLQITINNYYPGNIIDIREKLLEDFNDVISVNILGEKKLLLNIVNQEQENQERIISDILKTNIELDNKNKVVIDTKTGIIVSGQNIAIDTSYISFPLERDIFTTEAIEDDEIKNSFQTIGELFRYFQQRNIDIREKLPSLLYALRKSGILNAEIILQ